MRKYRNDNVRILFREAEKWLWMVMGDKGTKNAGGTCLLLSWEMGKSKRRSQRPPQFVNCHSGAPNQARTIEEVELGEGPPDIR